MPVDAEELARTVLVRLIPRGRYRTAAPSDARFAAFAPHAVRVAFRAQGARPAFLIFTGPGQDPLAVARAAAEWAAANWRPNAVQRRVSPGVVVVQVAPAPELRPSVVEGAAVPAAVWAVDSETGRSATAGRPSGAPAPGELGRAAEALARGAPAASLGELDYAERELMHGRARRSPPVVTGVAALLLVLFAARYGLTALSSLLAWGRIARGGAVNQAIALGFVAGNAVLLAGLVLGVALLLNLGGLADRAPGFASPSPAARRLSWVALAAVMLIALAAVEYLLPHALAAAGPAIR